VLNVVKGKYPIVPTVLIIVPGDVPTGKVPDVPTADAVGLMMATV
jgi:hypothetical protein